MTEEERAATTEKPERKELTPEERDAAVEAFFAKKRAQIEGREAIPGAEKMGDEGRAYWMGLMRGAAEGESKGAMKAGTGFMGGVLGEAVKAGKVVQLPAQLMGYDRLHKYLTGLQEDWEKWRQNEYGLGYEDWGTKLGDVGDKMAETAGSMGVISAEKGAAKYIAGLSAFSDTWQKARDKGQSWGRSLAEAGASGVIHFLGWKAFENKSLNALFKIPWLQKTRTGKIVQEWLKEGDGSGFSGLVRKVRNGSIAGVLVERGLGAVKAGSIFGVQEAASSMVDQFAEQNVKPLEEWTDEELKAKLAEWEAYERGDKDALKPAEGRDLGDMLGVALKAGLQGAAQGAALEATMGAGELALTTAEAREQTALAVKKLLQDEKGRGWIGSRNPEAMGVVQKIALEGGKVTPELLDAAGLPPDLEMRDVRRLAFDLRRDVEMADTRREMATEAYRKREELAERIIEAHKKGETYEFESEEQKQEMELALKERDERIAEREADAMVDAAQGMADTLFGKETGILVRRGTAEEQMRGVKAALGENADAKQLKDAEGTVQGWWNRKAGEVVLFRGADVKTVAHELGWHATRNWAEKNAPELLAKMRRYAEECPAELKAEIEKNYPDFKGDDLLDEIGAARFEREMGERFKEMMERSPEAKSWWQGLKDMIAEAWKGMVRGLKGRGIDWAQLEGMKPEEGMEWLVEKMASGERIAGEGQGFDFASRGGAEARSGEVRYARKLIGGKETAVVEGYPLSLREARDPDKVLGALAPLVGKSAAQIGESKLTRITEKSVEHLMNSDHARSESKASGKAAKKLWRGTVAGMSVTDDIIATSQLGAKEMPKHLNAEWKKGATFYRADTRFAVEVENGWYEIYPCKIIVSELNGERIVYDITEIGTPTPTTSVSTKTSTVGGPQGGLTANGGVGVSMGADYSTTGGTAQPGSTKAIRPQIAGKRGAENLGVTKMGEAEKMENEGASREDIWRKTGWWRGKDGKWRVELPDVKMKNERELFAALVENSNDTTLGRIMDAPELFKAYPQLKDTRIILSPEEVNPGEPGGWYDRVKNEITLLDAGLISWRDRPARERDLLDHYNRMVDSDEYRKDAIEKMDSFGIEHGTDAEEREYARQWVEKFSKGINRTNETRIRDLANDRSMRSVFGKIVHEVQHAIQRIEGFAGGASGKEEGYSRFAGEVEARNAARREAMTPDQRAATPPWATEDVAEESQIIRYSRKVAAVEDGEVEKSLDGIIGRTVKRSGGRSLAVKERKGEEGKIRSEAQKVFKALKKERIPLPNGGELYFAPDERTVEAYGGSVPDAWAEYCIHLVTHGVTNAETGERYRTYNETNVEKVLPEIRETIAANQVSIDGKGERIIFYRQKEKGASSRKSKFQKIVAEIDANGDLRIDLRYITGMERRGRVPGRLTTLEDALASGPTQGGATTDASSSTPTLKGQGGLSPRAAGDASKELGEGEIPPNSETGANYSTGGGAAQEGSDIKPQIRGIYTGSAADYANRSREGGKDDGPSVKKIGSGEGSQVYGWGLYGSTVREIAEGYGRGDVFAKKRPARAGHFELEGKRLPEWISDRLLEFDEDGSTYFDGGKPDADFLIKGLKDEGVIYGHKDAAEILKQVEENREGLRFVSETEGNIYEQTFFTNREPGDESHLLKWYEEVSDENWDRIIQQADKEGLPERFEANKRWLNFKEDFQHYITDLGNSGESVYQMLSKFLGSPQAASEFLDRAGIDGVKYPVDSYGKKVKDGDKAGWNYVAFSDEHIRVDHKWTDGQIRYSRKLKPEERPETKTVGEKITAIVGGSLKRRDGAITYKESETDARRLATEAKKVYEKYAKREYKLPTGGVLYFQPDARTVEAYGGDEAAAWGEYALHLITHTRGSGEERYRSFDGRSIDIVLPNIEEIIKADKVKESEGRIIFYKQTKKAESKTKSRYAYLVTEPDEDGNLRVDLRYITGMQDRGFLPGDTATLKEVISDRTAEGHALHQDQTGANYSTGGEAAQGGNDIKPQRRLTDAEERERTAEALKAVREGRVRVADNGGAPGEANEPGMAASEELLRAQAGAVAPSDMPELEGGARPVALSQSQMVALFRAVRACPSLPKVLQEAKRKGAAWVSRITKGSDVELNPEAFGIIDRTDRERVKSEMVAEGRFRNEDPVWNMKHSKAQCEKEREISETLLEDRLHTLAEDRVRGRKAGGGRAAANALAHEIGQLVMALPVSERVRTAAGKEGAAALKDLRTIGQGLMKALEKEWGEVKGDMDDPALIGSHLAEAVETVAWWRGVTKDQAAYEQIAREKGEEGLKAAEEEEKRIKTGLSRDHKGLAGELFGMFLAAPETLRERAPRAFNRIVEAMGANDALLEAYGRIATADAPTEVMAKIREQWTHEAQTELRKLEREVDAPLGGFIARAKRRMILNLHSTEGAVVSIVDDALAERVAAAKRAVKAAKRGGDRKEIAHAEANLVQVRSDAKATLAELKVGVLKKQRGGGMERSYAENMLTRVFGDIERDGVDLEDLRAYMKAKWNIALQGRADSYGLTPQEAQRALEGLKRKLGDDGYAALERTQKRFYDVRRKEILDNPEVEAAFGSALVDYWRSNTDYVRSERILGREQAAAYKAAREEWLKRNPGQADVLGDIELMVEMHRLRHGGSDGSVFAKPLEGSFKATGDPLAYTLANDMHILQFARRNALMIQIADLAKELRMEGFKEVSDAGLGRTLEGSRRYGSVAFMRDGERKLLIMPKVAAEGLGTMARSDVAGLVKANRWVSAILTQYSPRFAARNVFRNRAGAEINVPWLRESKLLTGARFAGLGPMARLAEMLMERAAVRLPDGAVRNGLTRLVWGENTTMYWIGEATRIAKLMFDPKGIRNLAERADEAAANGDLAAAQAILEEITKARDLMKKPIFAGQWRMMMGQAESADLDSVFRALDMRTNLEGTSFTGLRKAARAAKDLADTVKRFNTFEEARIKIVAELAAERARNNAEAKGKEWRYSQNEVDYITATMAGSPRYEMRGRWMNVLEAIPLGPFANVAMKGALRTIESMRMDPKAWWTKAAPRVAGRMAEIALWGAGGYALVAAMARRLFGDNEEAQAAIDGFENFGKRMARARACVSDYRLRNYDIVPMGLYGKWASFGINMPRGDEDRLIMPLTDTVGRFLATTDAAKRAGLHDPIDGAYTLPEAAVGTFMGSGLAPDITRGSMIWNLGKDLLYAWLQNPYNTFTQRPTYGQAVWENRFKSWGNAGDFFEATLKQAWNDVGGQVVLPATTWDEDEGNVPDEGKWVLGMADPKEAAAMPVGGRTIFRALHYVPMASSMLSGIFYMNCDGDARIARRLAKMQEKEKALRDHVAMKCLAMQLKNWDVAVDYSKILDAAVAENGWDEMDRALIEQALVRKLKAAAKKMGRENVPILDVFNKTMSERERAGMERYLTGIGWEME